MQTCSMVSLHRSVARIQSVHCGVSRSRRAGRPNPREGKVYRPAVAKKAILADHSESGATATPKTTTPSLSLSRRTLGLATAVGLSLPLVSRAALAFTPPPPGYQLHVDKLDGYSFLYPESWLPVTSSGNDCFYRNAFNAEENLFVDVSSPSSSSYPSIDALGSPEEVAEKLKKEYLDEFLSTRIGVKREGKVVDAVRREGGDGRGYYDIRIQIESYASTQQLAVTFKEVEDNMVKEFDRSYLTTLGVAGGRLYVSKAHDVDSLA